MNIKQHWLNCAKQIPSPNCDRRPDELDISLIVIHCISLPPSEFGHSFIDDLFCNRLDAGRHPYFRQIAGLRVSAHILIERDGRIKQYVPFNQRAWHAGVSCYRGRSGCNDFSIGIELEGCESVPYPDVQYERLAVLIETLIATYPGLSKQHITGHSHIAPGRKTDPGACFDWKRLQDKLSDDGFLLPAKAMY